VDAFTLEADGGYALDGEDFNVSGRTALRVVAGPEFEFLRP
jgi:hypothetical protein